MPGNRFRSLRKLTDSSQPPVPLLWVGIVAAAFVIFAVTAALCYSSAMKKKRQLLIEERRLKATAASLAQRPPPVATSQPTGAGTTSNTLDAGNRIAQLLALTNTVEQPRQKEMLQQLCNLWAAENAVLSVLAKQQDEKTDMPSYNPSTSFLGDPLSPRNGVKRNEMLPADSVAWTKQMRSQLEAEVAERRRLEDRIRWLEDALRRKEGDVTYTTDMRGV